MRVLLHGLETTESINNVLAATRITSERKIDALHDYFVRGINRSGAAALNGLDPDKFGEVIKKIHQVASNLANKSER